MAQQNSGFNTIHNYEPHTESSKLRFDSCKKSKAPTVVVSSLDGLVKGFCVHGTVGKKTLSSLCSREGKLVIVYRFCLSVIESYRNLLIDVWPSYPMS